MDQQDQHVGTLLVEASPAAPTDPYRLVAASVTRGRALRRRRRAGTAAAALAVLGVIGVGAAVVPLGGFGVSAGSTPAASDPTPSDPTPSDPTPSDPTPSAPTATPTLTDPAQQGPVRITVPAAAVPDTVARIVGRDGAGPLRTEAPYTSASGPDSLVAHFSWEGTLASVVIEDAGDSPRQQCEQGGPGSTCTTNAAGEPQLAWGPTTGDGVTAQGVTVWQQGFEVSVLSYNAPEGKGTPTMAAPPLSLDDLARIAGSGVWFG